MIDFCPCLRSMETGIFKITNSVICLATEETLHYTDVNSKCYTGNKRDYEACPIYIEWKKSLVEKGKELMEAER